MVDVWCVKLLCKMIFVMIVEYCLYDELSVLLLCDVGDEDVLFMWVDVWLCELKEV